MTVLLLALLAFATPPDEPDVAGSVARLRSPDAEERDAAIDVLETMGTRALPALRAAWADAEDPEDRARLAELVDRIAVRPLLRPTLLSLDVRDRPLAEVVASLNAGRRQAITLEPRDDPRWNGRRVTFDTGGPLGFWRTLDLLGVAGGIRLVPEAPSLPAPPPSSPSPPPPTAPFAPRIRLVDGDWPPPPTAYAGPYRVVLLSLNRHRQVGQVRPPAEAEVRETFSAALQLVAEPGIIVEANGPIRLLEATDDLGQDLRPPDPGSVEVRPTSLRRWSDGSPSLLTYRVPLASHAPAGPGRKLARLRGYAPIIAVTRTDERISFPLEGAEGRTFSGGGMTLEVRRLGRQRGQNGPPRIEVVDLTRREPPTSDSPPFAAGTNRLGLATLHPRFFPDDHLQVEDAQGRAYAIYSNVVPSGNEPTPDFRITLLMSPNLGPSARLRYYGVAAVATEVPFDFADLPLP